MSLIDTTNFFSYTIKHLFFWEKREKCIIFAEENEFRHNGD